MKRRECVICHQRGGLLSAQRSEPEPEPEPEPERSLGERELAIPRPERRITPLRSQRGDCPQSALHSGMSLAIKYLTYAIHDCLYYLYMLTVYCVNLDNELILNRLMT